MNKQITRNLLTACLGVACLLSWAQPARADEAAKKAMAEHLAFLAQSTVAARAITPETLRQSIALLQAACRLDPDEARFARLLAEAALQAGDLDTAIEAYNAVNRIQKNTDRVAQMRLIDLHSARMQTSDARLKYLNNVAASESLAAEVRSHAAHLAAQVYLERMQHSDAAQRLDESLRLFPLNPEALKLKYELQGVSGMPVERVRLLLNILRSNPAQPGAMARLADELADVGLHDQSLQWYEAAFQLSRAVGRNFETEDAIGLASQLVVTNQASAVPQIAQQLLERDPADVEAAMLGVLVAARSGDNERMTKAVEQAENALLGRAAIIQRQLDGQAEDDADEPAPEATAQVNVADDVKRLLERGDSGLIAGYAATLADLAWLRLYFVNRPDEAEQILVHLRQLLSPDSVTVTRLEGWSYLVSGRTEEARVKLSAVADRDPLAQLGMIRILEQEGSADRATQEARRLMDSTPSGVLGAIVHDALRDKRPRLAPGEQPPLTENGRDVKAELDAFPRAWMDFIDRPTKFYVLRVEPLKVTHAYAEPIIARITVQNLGPYDITVGPDGALRPDVWFDVQVRGVAQNMFPGVAFDRLSQHVVLKPNEKIVQNVRVDQGGLTQMLYSNATITMPIYYSAFNNPVVLPSSIAPGPGGQRQSMTKVVNRVGLPFEPKTIQATIDRLFNGRGDERLRSAELLLWFARQLGQREEDEAKAVTGQILGALRKASNDPDPQLRAWTNFVLARASDAEAQRNAIDTMLSDGAWESRLLAMVLVQRLDVDQWKVIAEPLAEADSDAIVKAYAAAVVEFADNPAATAPPVEPGEGEDSAAEPVAQP